MQLDFKYKAGNNEKYKFDDIWNSAIYIKKLAIKQLQGLYYLILWKNNLKKENT